MLFVIGNHPRLVGCPLIRMASRGWVAEKVAMRQPHVSYGGWRCCHELRSIGQSQEKSSFFSLLTGDVVDGSAGGRRDYSFRSQLAPPCFSLGAIVPSTRGCRGPSACPRGSPSPEPSPKPAM